MPIQKNEKQLYRITFITEFSFTIELTKIDLQHLIRTKKIIGYQKITIDKEIKLWYNKL